MGLLGIDAEAALIDSCGGVHVEAGLPSEGRSLDLGGGVTSSTGFIQADWS